MSKLTVETLTMPGADIGPENPLTPLRAYETASAATLGETLGDMSRLDTQESSILPYRLQDSYTRHRRQRTFKVAVLENEHLRATFLLEAGGRLWSLVHKPTERELLYVNPVFQPANLAVRDAWFAGGVEWNISIIGHSPFTCAPLFAGRVLDDDGQPVLRLYEWDRLRRVPFQVDCWLPDRSPHLFVRVRICNPNDHSVRMYWWSNIAVPEREDIRVLGPASHAYRHDYDGRLVEHDVPIYDGLDVTYTTNRRFAADLYFRIPHGHRPWIAALDKQGTGLVHASTSRLIGRKMFNWGMDPGGRRWQEFLAEPGHAYIEIQGGLAQTQGEYVPLPAAAEWSWLEAYGPIAANPKLVHGDNWASAYKAVERELDGALPMEAMEAELERTAKLANRPPAEILHEGSGWGAVERRRRVKMKQKPFATESLPFPDNTIGDEQSPWLTLLETGQFPYHPPSQPPESLMVQPEWRELLEMSVGHNEDRAHWLCWYHLGVMRYRAGEIDGAKTAWERSLQVEKSAWAYRDLAVVAREDDDLAKAAELWLTAARMEPTVIPLAIECCRALLDARLVDRQAEFIASLPENVQQNGRIRLLGAMGALERGDLATVERFFDQDELEIANIREKETILSDLWFGWQEKRLIAEDGNAGADREELRRRILRDFPPPLKFDFRLRAE